MGDLYLVEERRRQRWETVMSDADFVEDKRHGYAARYGIEHECHCVEDMFLDRMVRVTECSTETSDKAFAALEATLIERDALLERVRELERQHGE